MSNFCRCLHFVVICKHKFAKFAREKMIFLWILKNAAKCVFERENRLRSSRERASERVLCRGPSSELRDRARRARRDQRVPLRVRTDRDGQVLHAHRRAGRVRTSRVHQRSAPALSESALQNFVKISSNFSKIFMNFCIQYSIFQHFSKSTHFCKILQNFCGFLKILQILQNFAKFSEIR